MKVVIVGKSIRGDMNGKIRILWIEVYVGRVLRGYERCGIEEAYQSLMMVEKAKFKCIFHKFHTHSRKEEEIDVMKLREWDR